MRILMLLKVLEMLSVINSKYFIRTHGNRTASFTLKKNPLKTVLSLKESYNRDLIHSQIF